MSNLLDKLVVVAIAAVLAVAAAGHASASHVAAPAPVSDSRLVN